MLWYMQCVSVRGNLTSHRYILRGWFSQSLEVFLKKIDVCRVHIDFTKIQEVLCESDAGRVLVDFTQIQSFFKKLPSIECVSISSKFRESFVKLIFTKFGGFFQKFHPWMVG